MRMVDLHPDQIAALPVDQLALMILDDLIATDEWNDYNYLLAAKRAYDGEALIAIAEAVAWLRARALIVRTPGSTDHAAITVSRTGRRIAQDGPLAYYASERLQGGIHPLIEAEARPQFLIGKYELGVLAAMKAVEVRVRQLAGLDDEAIGVDLMNRSFGPTGALADQSVSGGERDGTRMLFAGAYALLRNPSGHREVHYDDIAEAADAVQTASFLMRILDRVQARVESVPGDGGPDVEPLLANDD